MASTARRAARGAAVTVVTSLALLPLAANAETASFHDASGDASGAARHGADLLSVRVDNGSQNVRIAMTFRNLVPMPRSGIGASVFIDTNGEPGPEYVLGAGLFDGTDSNLSRTRSWDITDTGRLVNCQYNTRLNYDADTAKVRLSKDCFAAVPGDGAVRVEIRSGGQTRDGREVRDWLGRARTFGPPVAQG
jgi:hypothetical protein